MWAVVSITWSLIMAIVIGGSWSFGEFLYKPSAGYHISDWSFGVGVLTFLFFLWVSYKGRLSIDEQGRYVPGRGKGA
jgi:hypothetical protein